MRLLLAGDIHIGRTSTRVGAGRRDDGLHTRDAWHRIVEAAIAERCGVVVLSGDVADRENGFWEAIGPLEQGIGQLAEAGIRTIAVSGNHDHGVLGRLADTLDPARFTLLGRGGRWQRHTIQDDAGRALLHLDGWSFPQERVTESPVRSYSLERAMDAPTLGLVHGDLDDRNSRYAPLSLADLQSKPVDGWLLGHIHAPRLIEGDAARPWVLYPGSPQALDPGESGMHGAWLVAVESGRLGAPRQIPLSTVRYERIEIDMTPVASDSAVEGHMFARLGEQAERLADESGAALRFISYRLRLVGATRFGDSVRARVASVKEAPEFPVGSVTVTVDRIEDATAPPIDLDDAARSPSALGVTARLLRAIERPDLASAEDLEIAERLMADARSAIERMRGTRAYVSLEKTTPDDDDLRALVVTQMRRLLTELDRQAPIIGSPATAATPFDEPLEATP